MIRQIFHRKHLLFRSFLLLAFTGLYISSRACTCPPTGLSLKECEKYEIIFKGTLDSVKDCGGKFGEAYFRVLELYKGNATPQFKVLFDCNDECRQPFNAGDEWIIYSRYKQIDNAMMDWCSRSRKYFKIEQQDLYKVNFGVSYSEEEHFLREHLGLHRLLKEKNTQSENRNIRPNTEQMVLILLCSLAAIVLFYFLFNKFFK